MLSYLLSEDLGIFEHQSNVIAKDTATRTIGEQPRMIISGERRDKLELDYESHTSRMQIGTRYENKGNNKKSSKS